MGNNFHHDCFSIVRAYRRVCGLVGVLGEKDEAMLEEQEKWRLEVQPLADEISRTTARTQLKNRLTAEKREYDRQETVNDDLLLTRIRFQTHMEREERWSNTQSDQEFDRLLKVQKRKHCKSGKPDKVAVSDNTRLRSASGVETSRFVPSRSRSRSRPRGRSASRTRSRARSASCIRSRRHRSSPSPMTSHSRSRRGHVDSKSPVRRGSEEEVLAAKAMAKAGKLDKDEANRKKGKTDGEQVVQSAQALAKAGNLNALGVLKEVDRLRAVADAAMSDYTGTGSNLVKMCGLQNHKSKEVVASMSEATTQLEQAMKKEKGNLTQLLSELDKAKAGALPGLCERLEAMVAEMEKCDKEISDHCDALEYLVGKQRCAERKTKQHEYYKRYGLQSALEGGGFGKQCAKVCAARFFDGEKECSNVLYDPAQLDMAKVCVWSKNSDAVVKVKTIEMLNNINNPVKTKFSSLTAKCMKEGWKGAIGPVGPTVEDESIYPDPVMMKDQYCGPWLTVVKPGVWRDGPGAFAWPGCGSLVSPALGLDMMLLVMDGAKVAQQGVSLKDVHSFLTLPSGMKFMDDGHLKLFKLEVGSMAWVPYGWLGVAVCPPKTGDEKEKDKAKRIKKPDDVFGAMFVLNILNVQAAKGVNAQVWAGMKQMSTAYHEIKKEVRMWQVREQEWRKFVGLVEQDS